jgi:hemoglobin/transferrin/lactoferrin receptor protein
MSRARNLSIMPLIPHFLPTLASLALLSTAFAQDAPAPPDPTETVLAPVVVTAGLFEEPLADAPNTVNIVGKEEIRDNLYRSLPDIFSETPGVLVQKTSHGQGSPFIRGFTGYRNLLLIDGIRLNNSVFRDGPNQYWNTVDSYSIERLELVKGQGSVLYGSDAIGGTVNVLTKSADVLGHADGERFVGGSALYRWSSAEQSNVGRLETEFGEGGRYGFFLGVSGKDYGDLRAAGIGEQRQTGYEEWDADARLDYFFDSETRLTLAYQRVEQDDVWRTHRTIYGESWHGTEVGDEQRRSLDQDRQLAYAQFEANALDGFVDRMKLNVSWQHQGEEQDRIRKIGDGRRDLQGFGIDTLGLWAQFESDTPFGVLTYGTSYYRDWVDSQTLNFAADGTYTGRDIQGPVGDDATYDLFGLFAQDRIALAPSLDLIVGGRYTYAAADIGAVEDPVTGAAFSINDEWNNGSGSTKLLWSPLGDDRLELYGGVAQGFRAPNLSDLSRLDSARSNELETAAPNLDPEKFLNSEIGLRVRGDGYHAGLAYYYTDIDDMIVRAPTGRVIDGAFEVTKLNASSGYIHGFELDGDVKLGDSVTLFGSFSWMDGEADGFPTSGPESVREPVSRLLPPTGLLGIRWDATDALWFELVGRASAEQDDLSSSDLRDTQRIPPGGTPTYVIGILRAGWQATDSLLLTGALENFTDEEYRVHGSGQNEAGLNVILGASVSF